MKNISFTVSLPEKMEEDLKIIIKKENISKSAFIRDALKRYLSIKKFQQLRKQVLPFAEAQGLLTDEDVFKTIS